MHISGPTGPTGLRIVAAVSGIVGGFEPTAWTPLPDERGHRVLVTDGDREFVASLHTGPEALRAGAERLSSAVLRMLLPDSDVTIPEIVVEETLPAALLGLGESERPLLHVAHPLPGTPSSTADFLGSEALVVSLARFLAALHDADPGPVADAGLVVRDSAAVRDRLLAELDRGADTGRVPSALLQRWETALETVSSWHFLACPVHGAVSVDAFRVAKDRIVSVSDLDRLGVGDPATDLAAVSDMLGPDVFEVFMRAYTEARTQVDPGLVDRLEFLAEFAVLDWFLQARDSGNSADIASAEALLASLADLAVDPEPEPRTPAPPRGTAATAADGTTAGAVPPAPTAPSGASTGARTQSASATQDASEGPTTTAGTGLDSDRKAFRPSAPVDEQAASEVPTTQIER
ncbi:phosphotransferase [Brevibacterium samyangense]|uniref:Aminoglycoside phosphotransferase domain-containing protein n=1 Tax=Brevibacterium samyangense TaxID=366888 RepID=A0ABN2T9H0_9MICO